MDIKKKMEELKPREYQRKIIKIAIEKNTIVYLPTGSGKTFVSLCVLKELVKDDFSKPYSNGGKIAFVLVNTVALVQQHAKYFQINTPYKISSYTGDTGVDFWKINKWREEYDSNNILVMTAQIFLNCLRSNYIDLNKINAMIFDECHQAVESHSMRQIMDIYKTNCLHSKPRIIGLTATLLNGNVKTNSVLNEVSALQDTFLAEVAAIDDLADVLGYSTNPKECLIRYQSPQLNIAQDVALSDIENLLNTIRNIPPETERINFTNLQLLDKEKPFHKYIKLLMDAQIHIQMLGMAGAITGLKFYCIHLESEKYKCTDRKTDIILNAIITRFVLIQKMFNSQMSNIPEDKRLFTYSTNKVLTLLEILLKYKENCSKELCGIIFVQRKNTAVILYHILKEFISKIPELAYIKPEFIIGFNSYYLSGSRESLYYTKINRKVFDHFRNKECNLLIASNVIEEGVDIQNCTLVVKFDTPTNYREYVQSKGRARHETSLFYVMVENKEATKFAHSYRSYQSIEKNLQNYFSKQNELKDDSTESYNDIPPFYVDGPNSAQITMLSAVPLLMMYCSSLPTDKYTTYEPEWYIEPGENSTVRVVVQLPIVCPLKDMVKGDYFHSKKDAKHSAAFKACISLYKCGEFDINLIPKRKIMDEIQTKHLFLYWPENTNKEDGIGNRRKIYEKRVPEYINEPLVENQTTYLHIIQIKPLFKTDCIENLSLSKLYANVSCFGILTSKPLPTICEFPLYTSQGELSLSILVNQQEVTLKTEELLEVKEFHHLIFSNILKLVKTFFTQTDNTNIDHLYVVPIKTNQEQKIDFQVIRENKEIVDQFKPPTIEAILGLVVNRENFIDKIVTPYYREEDRQYVVVDICEHLSSKSMFPKEGCGTFAQYFEDKYRVKVHNVDHPLLLVKPISSKLNFIKPRGESTKKNRDESFDSLLLHLVPEFCIRQNFPAELWLQAKLLPSIFERTIQFLRAEEIRCTIAVEANLGARTTDKWLPLKLDNNLIYYNTNLEIPVIKNNNQKIAEEPILEMDTNCLIETMDSLKLQRNIYHKINDTLYPWLKEEEPKDIKRNLDCTILDIKYYSKFIYGEENPNSAKVVELNKPEQQLAIHFEKQFEHKPISFLNKRRNNLGPDLSAIYQCFATAKCNEVVNLERLETLGDSFLKYIISLFIFTRYPTYSEGESTTLKGRLISNRNLLYLGVHKNICTAIKMNDLAPRIDWRPPGYALPDIIKNFINAKQLPTESLFYVNLSNEEQITGKLSNKNYNQIQELSSTFSNDDEEVDNNSSVTLMGLHILANKTIADVIEALIGAYYSDMGSEGAIKFMEWLGLIPKSEKLLSVLTEPLLSPLFDRLDSKKQLEFLLPQLIINQVENILGYEFSDKAYILQAITHPSYITNRITLSYEMLEFIGDAVLDFLITSYIYESCGYLTPGDLTDLRSALVNNEIFAAYVVKLKLYKYLKYYSATLNQQIMKFVIYQERRNYAIDDDVLILLNEKDIRVSECVDVPKVLGDLFESFIGAVFLDSGRNLSKVWEVIYKIMHEEIEMFSKNIPKNAVKMVYEKLAPLIPKFHSAVVEETNNNSCMIKLDFQLNGIITRVHGFGDNKKYAKKAASKLALKLLNGS